MKNPDVDTAAKSYLELSNQMYTVLIGAFSTRNARTIDNAKFMYEILFRPYPQPLTVESVMRENFDRTQEIVSLTVNELQTMGRRATEVTTSLAETGAKLQQAWLQYVQSMMQAGFSSTTAATPLANGANEAAKRVVEASKPRPPAATTSSN